MEQRPEQQGQFQQQQGEEANPPAPRNERQRNRRMVSLAEQVVAPLHLFVQSFLFLFVFFPM